MIVVLYEPEIPPNTGNIARTCAAFGVELHLIEPLGFCIDDRHLKRAGLDYWDHVSLRVWPNWEAFRKGPCRVARLIMTTTRANRRLAHFSFQPEDALVFGPETRGLPEAILAESPHWVRIPTRSMEEGGVRSLNLSTACGIFLFTALADTGLVEQIG